MLNNNGHQNSSCTFAEQTAEYLYSEVGDSEKLSFESHLRDCQTCAVELADFSFLHSSIQEWRAADFEPLPTPLFVMPTIKETISEKPSWIETIKSYLNFTPGFLAGTAATIFIMIAGIIWFSIISAPRDNVAKSEKPTIQNPSPVIQPTDKLKTGNDTVASNNTPPIETNKSSRSLPVEIKEKSLKAETASVKTSPRKPVLDKSDKSSLPTVAKEIRPKTQLKNDVPSLAVEEDEEDSLRLSDLFDEVGKINSSEVNNE